MRYTLLFNSRTDQRVWRGVNGNLYLADHSGDSLGGCAGTPSQTDDGPLRLIEPSEFVWPANERHATLEVVVESTSRPGYVGVGWGTFSYLARLLQKPMFMEVRMGLRVHRYRLVGDIGPRAPELIPEGSAAERYALMHALIEDVARGNTEIKDLEARAKELIRAEEKSG